MNQILSWVGRQAKQGQIRVHYELPASVVVLSFPGSDAFGASGCL